MKAKVSGIDTYHSMLRKGVRPFINLVRSMQWTWLHAVGDLVVGDNPFCRHNAAGTFVDYPLARSDFQVAFPLGRHLCLLMHRNPLLPYEIDIDQNMVRRLNRLQVSSAEAKVWGPRESALRTDTDILRHPIDINLSLGAVQVLLGRVE